MTISECMEQRRSIRKYTDQEVEREKIEEVLRAALLAPSGKTGSRGNILYTRAKKRTNYWMRWKKG